MELGFILYFIFVSTYIGASLLVLPFEYINYGSDYIVKSFYKSYKTLIVNVLFIPFFISLIFSNLPNTYNENFNIYKFIVDNVVIWLSTDIIFWTTHRFLHIPGLYKLFHKKHHEFITPLGFTTLYANPVDFVFTNVTTIYLPLILLKSHYFTYYFWTFIGIFNSIYISHSSISSNNFHLLHHKKFNYNYGTDIFMDKLLNSYSIH